MGLWTRFRLVLRGKASRALDSLENPAEALELAYEKQMDALQRVRRGVADVVTAQKQLEVAGQRLQARVAAMRTQKETLEAQYSAAQATVQAGETATGISREMDEVQQLLERARDKMLHTQARAEAVTELMDTGVLSRLGAGGVEGIEAQVRATAGEQSVDQRLAAMKAELGLAGPAVSGRVAGGGATPSDAASETTA